jgi:hypothetical protein
MYKEKKEKIEICSLGVMRGRSIKRSIIIGDEMQNSVVSQMKMLLTRIGEGSRMIITGDIDQSDLKEKNGLKDVLMRLNDKNVNSSKIKIIELEKNDIERSEIVKLIYDIYDRKLKQSNETTNLSPNESINLSTNESINLDSTNETTNLDSTNEIRNETKSLTNMYTNESINLVSRNESTNLSPDEPKKKINEMNDAALIPRNHIPKNIDIFFDKTDF